HPAEESDRDRIAQHAPQRPVAAVLASAKTVAVLHPGSPIRQGALPRIHTKIDADVVAQNLAAPHVVVACDHQHGDAAIVELRDGGKHAERSARHYAPPLEPELEEITIDDERPGTPLEVPKETDERPLHVACDDS